MFWPSSLHALSCSLGSQGRGRVRPQVREPAVTKDQQKDMMAFYYKKQEEFKVAAAHYYRFLA